MKFTLFLLAFVPLARAGDLSGAVTGAAGDPIPGVRITLRSRLGAAPLITSTSDNGLYRFPAVAPGDYLIEAAAEDFDAAAQSIQVTAASQLCDLQLGLAALRSSIVVIANGTPQTADEVSKSTDSFDAAALSRRALYSATETLRYTPGMRVQTLGGPGAFTRIVTRGLRPQDTEIAIDGLRFRDAATTQGDATPFLENLFLVDTSRIEVLRGAGSSIYGSHATGGVVNLVTDSGGGCLHGEVRAEGGGLGMMRGLARLAGGTHSGRIGYSAGFGMLDVLSGLDGDDRYRNLTAQGALQFRITSSTQLTVRFWGGNSFAQINSTPFAAAASVLPPRGPIVAVPGVNFTTALDDPDSSRVSHFGSGALVLTQRVSPAVTFRATYHRVITRRIFADGPAGLRLPPAFSVADRIRGGTDTVDARTDIQLTSWNTLTGGFEFERESYRSRHVEARLPYFTAAGQRDRSFYVADQSRFWGGRLQLSLSGRLQSFALRAPEFTGGTALYQGLAFTAPPRASTGDVSLAWLAAPSTKLRAHTGNGYRAPSIYERFGASFFEGAFTALGDPRLRAERTWAFDAGIDQYLVDQRVRISATWFYTNLQETIAFDSSGFLVPARDPFRRSSGYINTGGGISRGIETSVEAAAWRGARITAAYTYTNADVRRSTVRDRDFFSAPLVSPQQFSTTFTQRLGKRTDLNADVWIAVRHPAIFSNRAFLFAGPRKLDLIANHRIPVTESLHTRLYAKLSNVLDSQYLEGGYRTPGRWALAGLALEF